MKRITPLRKNALLVATPRGGETAAILGRPTSTCQRHGLIPRAYLTLRPANLQGPPVSRLDEWLPEQSMRKAPSPAASTPSEI